jgi:putative hydrolases of HD superfamily
MYRMSIITLLCPPSLAAKLDIARCTKMALVHDMAESLVGDITPVDGVTKSEKSRREQDTMRYLCSGLLGNVDGGQQGEHIQALWREYEDGVTAESVFVHDVDKMELLLQMLEYERSHEGRIDLGEFSWVAGRIQTVEVQSWAKDLLADREKFWATQGKEGKAKEESITAEKKEQMDEYYGRTNGHEEVNGGS